MVDMIKKKYRGSFAKCWDNRLTPRKLQGFFCKIAGQMGTVRSVMRTSTPTIHPRRHKYQFRRHKYQFLVLLLAPVLVNLIIK